MEDEINNKYSWQDAADNGYNVGNADDTAGNLQQWSRSTVADGMYLNKKTIIPLSGRDEYLLNKLNEVDNKPLNKEVYRHDNDGIHYIDDNDEKIYDIKAENIYGVSGYFENKSTLTGSEYINLIADETDGTTRIELNEDNTMLYNLLNLFNNMPTDAYDYVIGCTKGKLKWVRVGYTERN